MRALEHEQRLVARERESLSEAEGRMRHREEALRQREDASRKRLSDEIESQVRQARREIDDVVAQLKAKAAALASAPRLVSTGDTGAVRVDARAAVDEVARRVLAGEAPGDRKGTNPQSAIRNPQSPIPTVSVGDRVILGALRLEAVVTGLHDGTAELDVRGKRMRASTRDLRVIAPAGATAAAPAKVSVHVELQPRGAMALDLNVIGCTVDEAIARAERFLDESLLTDQRVIRLIHG